ncbi:hypothetical protein LXM56_10400 [Lysinibacillus fusiformis]|uniref:hypothetical protein n=1 Tax=Lysinibacillus fusiformis TaxID=28031 RepID=UPI001E3C3CBC|nr:hypothetical protein [Lysinibacillus fusiformis]MCE4044537.1 hypothetical protein [Lysinibacillus fusiformis]
MKSLHGKRLNKKQAEKLEELFDLLSMLHKSVAEEGYDEFLNRQGLTDNYDFVVNTADDVFISFGFAEKRLEDM